MKDSYFLQDRKRTNSFRTKKSSGIYEPWGEHNKYDEIILMKELK